MRIEYRVECSIESSIERRLESSVESSVENLNENFHFSNLIFSKYLTIMKLFNIFYIKMLFSIEKTINFHVIYFYNV